MRTALIVILAILTSAVAASAADILVRPGDKVKGVLAPGGGGDRVSFDAPAGGELTVKLKGSGGLRPDLRILDAAGEDLPAPVIPNSSGKKRKISDYVLPATGRYTLLVFGSSSLGGEYKLTIRVEIDERVKLESPVVGSGENVDFEFHALAGTVAKIKVSRGKSGKATPEIVSLVGPSGSVPLLPPSSVSEKKITVKGVVLTDDGRYTLTARPRAPTSGSLKVKVSLDPSLPKDTFVRRGSSISGKVLVPEAEPEIIFEQEPNDSFFSAQYIGAVKVGTDYAVAGISDAWFLDYDVFRFVVRESTQIGVALGHLELGYDFDAYVYTYDLDGTPRERLVLDSVDQTEAGAFDLTVVPGDYEIVDVVIEPWAGYGIYVLGVSGSTFGSLGATAARQGSTSPPEKIARRRGARTRHYRPFAADFRTDSILVERRERGVAPRRPGAARRARRERFGNGGARGDERMRRLRTLGRCIRASGDPEVVSASPVYRFRSFATPDDDLYNRQWHYRMIELPQAWDVTTGDEDVIVAVLDTGIRSTHPDLAANLTSTGYDFISDLPTAADGNGRDDDPTDPGDGVGAEPSSYHGTHVAGTVAAVSDNARGVTGVAWNVKIMPLRVLGVGGGNIDDIAAAIRYAAGLPNASGRVPAHPARIINMSLGGETLDNRAPAALVSAIQDATAAGVLVVCAAGNASTSRPSWPAAIPECLSVSAVNANADAAFYTNFGSTVDIAAPGGETGVDRDGDGHDDGVLSTFWDESRNAPDYRLYQGTSMAAPHIAGVAALALSVDSTLTVSALRSILETTATDLGSSGRDDVYGHGLVNARAAVLAAGSAGGGPASLTLSRNSVHFGSNETGQTLLLGNSGSDPLTITSVTHVEESGGDWLSTTLSATSVPSTLTLTASRIGLAAGSYRATVTIASTAGDATVQVSLEVGGGDTPDVGTLGIFLIDPWFGLIIADADALANDGYAFRLDIEPGAYYLLAASDDDGNGIYGEEGELLGAWPVLSEADILFLEGGEHLTEMDFPVSRDEDLGFAGLRISR